MKKLIAVLSYGLMGLHAQAQSKWYIMPTAGTGITNASLDFYTSPGATGIVKSSDINFNGQLMLGYKLKRWSIEGGLQYLTTGYRYNDITVTNVNLTQFYNSSLSIRYNHINVPLQLAYRVPLSSRFSILPTIGITMGYNIGEKYIDKIESFPTQKMKTEDSSFKDDFHRISCWGTAGVRLEYIISKRVSIVGGPQFQYMINNFLKVPADAPYHASERNYALDYNAGVKVNL